MKYWAIYAHNGICRIPVRTSPSSRFSLRLAEDIVVVRTEESFGMTAILNAMESLGLLHRAWLEQHIYFNLLTEEIALSYDVQLLLKDDTFYSLDFKEKKVEPIVKPKRDTRRRIIL